MIYVKDKNEREFGIDQFLYDLRYDNRILVVMEDGVYIYNTETSEFDDIPIRTFTIDYLKKTVDTLQVVGYDYKGDYYHVDPETGYGEMKSDY